MNTASRPSNSVDDLGPIRDLVRDFSGLDFPENRQLALRRVTERAGEVRGLTVGDLAHVLSRPENAHDLEEFVASLTVGETHFFRNQPQLDAVRATVLPQLIDARRKQRRLRIWSAGCATGEEPYSLAIMLDELLPAGETWDTLILATDINRVALDRARAGVYGTWSFRQVPAAVIGRYFTQVDREYHLSPHIRQMVTFEYLNLAEAIYRSPSALVGEMDLIFCRNVLIYFPDTIARAVVNRLEGCLAPGGWFVTGHAESPMPIFRERFATRDFPMSVLYTKRSEPAVVTPPAHSPTGRGDASVRGSAPSRDASVDVPPTRDGGEDGTYIAHPAEDVAALRRAAMDLASAVRLEDAEHLICQAIAREPLCAPGHYLHGVILTEMARTEDAFEALRRATYLQADFPLAHYSLGLSYASAGNSARARREMERVRELLDGLPNDREVESGDGLTVAGLRELADLQLHLSRRDEPV